MALRVYRFVVVSDIMTHANGLPKKAEKTQRLAEDYHLGNSVTGRPTFAS
ncbi:hypothetical protein HFO32_22600 [Rhizobium leguminosarum]|nr:hypothetical protein [Rhizobium leguminosarum]MBY5684916.1 hypothetical protein [Rhizobium leguminosarum]